MNVRVMWVAAPIVALAGTLALAQQPRPQPQPVPAAPAAQKTLAQSFGLFVYPAKGQTLEVQNKDEYECYQWAKQSSGIDPLVPQQAQPVPAAAPGGTAVRGGARGAAAGAAIGAVAGDAGKGAAIGATAGGLRAAARGRQQQAASQQAAAAAQQQAAQGKATFNKAFSACLEARSYSVK